jgi:hypothetical protein
VRTNPLILFILTYSLFYTLLIYRLFAFKGAGGLYLLNRNLLSIKNANLAIMAQIKDFVL